MAKDKARLRREEWRGYGIMPPLEWNGWIFGKGTPSGSSGGRTAFENGSVAQVRRKEYPEMQFLTGHGLWKPFPTWERLFSGL